MMISRAAKFRLYPTLEQAQKMAQFAGAVRFVYNLALEQRRDWWKPGRRFNFVTQGREIKHLRAEVEWLSAVPTNVLHQALRDLDQAYHNWWSGRSNYPNRRKKGLNDSFRFSDLSWVRLERTGKTSFHVKLPKLGWVQCRGWRAIPGIAKNVTISLRSGQWYISIICQSDIPAGAPSVLPAVGVDCGVVVFAALSDGTVIPPVNIGKKALPALRKAQRNLSRKKRGSNNRRKAIRRIAKIQMRIANARKDFLHKVSTTIAKNHGTVVVEALKVRDMTASAKGAADSPGKNVRQKAGLNRAILDQGWGAFQRMLAYKLADRGGVLIDVPAAYTSQTCAECGGVDAANRLDQARFVCVGCGHIANADTNAAIVILQRGLDKSLKPVEGHRSRRPDETGSIRRAA